MSTQELSMSLLLMARLNDDAEDEETDIFGDNSEGNVDEEWGADISVGDEGEGEEEKKKEKEEEKDEEENE